MLKDIAQRLFDELQQQLPKEGAALSGRDFSTAQREFQLALQAALSRLDLVTREEFDAQTAVLLRTRQKLEDLESQIAKMNQP